MSAFLTKLKLERLDDTSNDERGTWQVIDNPLVYTSDILGGVPIVVPVGFVTDLASVPRIPVAWLLAGGVGHAAAVVHDWLYSTQMFSKDRADNILYEALMTLGLPPWQCKLIYMGPHWFGQSSWDAHNQKQPEAIVRIFPEKFELRAA